jgi:3-oxoacyl-[acyl-carrier-protein] synthase II
MSRRVVVTGIGAVTPLGLDIIETWKGILGGRCGISRITRFDVSQDSTRIAGQIAGFAPEKYMSARLARFADEFLHYAVGAASMAIEDAGLAGDEDLGSLTGTCIGTAAGGASVRERQQEILMAEGPRSVSALTVPLGISDMGSGYVSMKYKLRGPNHCVVSACASGASAIGEAFNMIRWGSVERMVAGGAEGLSPLFLAGFGSAKTLSTRNESPDTASRPFDSDRDGFVMSEGGAVLVLEELVAARTRGAKIYGEIIGYGSTADAHHITAPRPDGDGAARAMRLALKQGEIGVEQIGYVNAHATGTPMGDEFEVAALAQVFGNRLEQVPVSSTKSMTGHMLGAAGAVEAVFCLLAMRDSMLPPTINLNRLDPKCQIDAVPNIARKTAVEFSLSNSFGFGGHNVSLLFRRL